MDREIVWLGHDNSNNYVLKEKGVAVDLTSVTQMTLTIVEKSKTINSTNLDTDPIRWKKTNYATGEFRLFLGSVSGLTAGLVDGILVVYDPTNTNGVVWGKIPLSIESEVEIPGL